jgi:TonB family protein
MASALASPPPFHIGPTDPRANARKFLERALVLSALVHLSVVGAFRVADERYRTRAEGEYGGIPEHVQTIDVLISRLQPIREGTGAIANPKEGAFTPTTEGPEVEISKPGDLDFTQAKNVTGPGGDPDAPKPGPNEVRTDLPAFRVVDTLPELIDAPKPPYPEWAREAGIEGRVFLRALVGTDGHPKRVVVVSGPKGLTDGAEKAVWRWRFHPGLSNRSPVEVWVEIPVVFRLSDR